MSTITITKKQPVSILGDTRWLNSAWQKFAAEASAVISAIFTPHRVLADVERMAALHRAAAMMDATDPARAAELRQRAGRIGL